jgi:hypothetical protein
VFENRMLRRIFGRKGEKVAGYWKRLDNDEIYIICTISFFLSSFLSSTAQLRPWPPPQNPAEFLGGF